MSGSGNFNDSRFSKVFSDPKFKTLPKHERKVRIDKRFQSMFTDDGFKVKYTVDKRGKRISKSTSEDFKRFYDLSSDEENNCTSELDESDEDSIIGTQLTDNSSDEADDEAANTESACVSEKVKKLSKKQEKRSAVVDDTVPYLDNEEKKIIEKNLISRNIREKLKDMDVDYARGEGRLFSESSSDESESEESESEIYHQWNELDKDADTIDKITNRLAVCNMDWDRIRAVDLMVLFNSFLPTEGSVHSIIIYPSEFGLKRMAEEEVKGPAELVTDNANKSSSDSGSDSEAEEGKQFHMERMRQYQLHRLKYYYAVATFDSPETADLIYTNCNGLEYESSGIRLDLRFIDDDVTFDQEPKDSCNSVNNVQKYEPLYFTNTALQQAKVELTWDETDPRRLEYARKISEAAKTQDLNDSDIENLVALSSSSEEDESEGTFESTMSGTDCDHESEASEEDDPIQKFRNLLKEIEENEKDDRNVDSDAELEITWGADDGGKSTKTTKISKVVEKDNEKEFTPFQRMIEKKKEKSKIRRAKKLLTREENGDVEGDDDEQKNLQKKKSKKLITSEEDGRQKKELELLLLDEANENKHHFSLKKMKENEKIGKKKRKFKKRKDKPVVEDDFQVDVTDERFSALYSSHLFNIDPTDPKFHKTKGMEAFVREKQKRLSQKENSTSILEGEPPMKKVKDAELSSLVRSLKSKTKMMLPNKLNKRK